MFSVSPEIYSVLLIASRWIFAFFALMLFLFALAWHHSDRRERRERIKNLPGTGTVGELVVLSGSDELPRDTWFPVPREGVLGSLRSCDLVVPCPGVRSQHLDFSWQDGTGLLIRPRAGCEVLVYGIPVSRRGAYADAPLLHGSLLQVGSAVLRLQLFAALSDTNRPFVPKNAVPAADVSGWNPMVPPSVPDAYAAVQPWQGNPVQAPGQPYPLLPADEQQPVLPAEQSSAEPLLPDPLQQAPSVQRRKRADRWKEDWSE